MNKRVEIDEQMLISAVRYALGRSTYIVGWTVSEVKRVWGHLSTNVQEVIERDINETKSLGMKDDVMEWRSLMEFIESNKSRSKGVGS